MSAALSAIPVVAILLAVAPAAREQGERWELVGTEYESHPGLPALLGRIEAASASARAELAGRHGLGGARLAVRQRLDLSRGEPTLASPAPAPPVFSLGRMTFEGTGVVVTLPARRFLRQPGAAVAVVAHELHHALLAASLGSRERYEAIPRWFREGAAARFAGEGEALVAEALVSSLLDGKPAAAFLVGLPVDGESGGPGEAGGGVGPAEAWLAVRSLETRLGEEGLQAIVRQLLAGESFAAALSAVAGVSLERLRWLAAEHARGELARLRPSADEAEFRRVLEARAAGDFRQLGQRSEALVGRSPRGPLVGTLRYFQARAELETSPSGEKLVRLRTRLEDLLISPSGGAWRPEVLLLLGECWRREGQIREARARFEEVMEAHGEDPLVANRAREALERLVVK